MPLLIKTTGLEEYAPGGTARVKVLLIGGPGAGKTRWSSYFPKTIYADCEKGLASVADRRVPYVGISTSADMLDLLNFLKQESRQPAANRQYETVVIDTLDAYQRKVKQEWMEANRKEQFSGYDAWGYLTTKMQTLLTRLLNLDMNVVVNVHYKDKTTRDDQTGRETHELMLQLQGEVADTAFNDFDLVGWIGTYFAAENGERVQKRGITFKPSPDKPFLKDRLHVTPGWLEVTFADSDYTNLFERVQAKAEEIAASETVGEIPSTTEEQLPVPVIAPGGAGSGPLPPRDLPLDQLDKQTLLKRCRDAGISSTVDGAAIRQNTLKAELVEALKAHQEKGDRSDASQPAAPAEAPTNRGAAADPDPQSPQGELNPEPVTEATDPEPAPAPPAPVTPAPAPPAPPASGPGSEAQPKDVTHLPVLPDSGTEGKSAVPTHEEAIATVKETLGGTVIDEDPEPEATPAPPVAPVRQPATPRATAPAGSPTGACEDCGKDLAGEKPDFVKLAWIKYRKKLCAEDYQKRKVGRTA